MQAPLILNGGIGPRSRHLVPTLAGSRSGSYQMYLRFRCQFQSLSLIRGVARKEEPNRQQKPDNPLHDGEYTPPIGFHQRCGPSNDLAVTGR